MGHVARKDRPVYHWMLAQMTFSMIGRMMRAGLLIGLPVGALAGYAMHLYLKLPSLLPGSSREHSWTAVAQYASAVFLTYFITAAALTGIVDIVVGRIRQHGYRLPYSVRFLLLLMAMVCVLAFCCRFLAL